MKHQCDGTCFQNFEKTIKKSVGTKIKHYERTDSRPKFKDCERTMTPKQALSILKDSNGFCTICSDQLRLHDWKTDDSKQFSFDRIDDDDTHHKNNVQITCLRCNLQKANDTYQPDPKYLREYSGLVKEFYEINSLVKNDELKNPLEMYIYAQTLVPYIAYLHEQVYGARKKNVWFAVPSDIKPKKAYPIRHYAFSDEYEWQ